MALALLPVTVLVPGKLSASWLACAITGAFAERMKFSVFLLSRLLWATLPYDPLAHWVCTHALTMRGFTEPGVWHKEHGKSPRKEAA